MAGTPKAPCKGCTDRCIEPNCHNTCEAYNNWLKQHRELKEAERRYKKNHMDLYYTEKYYNRSNII